MDRADPHAPDPADAADAARAGLPAVAYDERPWMVYAGIGAALLIGGSVFAAMNARLERTAHTDVPTRAAAASGSVRPEAPPPKAPDLFPPAPPPPPFAAPAGSEMAGGADSDNAGWRSPPPPPPPPPPAAPTVIYRNAPAAPPPPAAAYAPPPPPEPWPSPAVAQRWKAPALVLDLGGPAAAAAAGDAAGGAEGAGSAASGGGQASRWANPEQAPARASRIAQPRQTVPQGAMISAVLETAIDSDLPGYARAVVSHDVAGFDGREILIPRGSRLIGQYRADAQPGQSRVFVLWTRLIRPDGVSVDLASPGTDPLGRAGLTGRIDRRWTQRYGPGLLTALVTGALARAGGGNQVIIGGGQSGATQPTVEPVKPVVRVAPGSAVQVFVARDLDFSAAAPTRRGPR